MTAAAPLPPEFDPALYRAGNADLAALPDEALVRHFADWGEAEGRIASIGATREGFLAEVVARHRGGLLEIGPFCRPLVRGADVAYLDMLDAEALRARAIIEGLDAGDCPARSDFVGDIAAVDRGFAGVISSHAIEHQPDLVRHLRRVADLLPTGGRYFLIVPDKRYCFDAFIPESSVAGVLQAHREGRRRHTLQSVVEHRALTTHNNGALHWSGVQGEAFPANQVERIAAALAEYDAAGDAYLDVHAWYLTPAVFRRIAAALFALGLTGLAPARVYATPRDRFEFCAVLEKV